MCRRGDIYYADLGAPTGCCQSGFRPVLIVSNNTANAHAPVITVVPITSRYKAMHMPTHVVLHRCAVTGLTQTSVALAEQVTTIDKAQLQNRVGAVLDEQLMEQIKSEIINTALKEGEALPSVRSLAGELRISALTVKKAYDKLEEEGFVTTIHGKGTYVTASDKQLALEARQREAEADFEKAIDRALAMGMSREDILETVTLLLEEK